MGLVARLHRMVAQALAEEAQGRGRAFKALQPFDIELPPQRDLGDFATNAALAHAKALGVPPRLLAKSLGERLCASPWIARAEVAGPGFLNLTLSPQGLAEGLAEILRQGETYGCSEVGQGQKVQVEFVSANPTGPLHVGHGRGAAVGDSLARILEAAGYQVVREFYINDAEGSQQMRLLAQSLEARYLELLGSSVPFPQEGYRGEYVRDLARAIWEEYGTAPAQWPPEERLRFFLQEGRRRMLEAQQATLERFRVRFDVWFSEQSLYEGPSPTPVEAVLERLKEEGHAYEHEGALWLRSTAFGDEKDRVLVRSDGTPTYLASDLAYHRDKFQRGFQRVINLWGADHHGYIARVKAGLAALGYDPERLEVLILQLVRLTRGQEPVRMSKREGELYTLDELLDEVGVDAARFFFLMRSADSHLDFDLEQAKKQSSENPVYYVQYAHARIRSILRQPQTGEVLAQVPQPNLLLLQEPEERQLMLRLCLFEEEVAAAAQKRAPHRLPPYLLDVASHFHGFYTRHRVLGVEPELSRARLALVEATAVVLRNGLSLLGVEAPERM